MKKNPPAVAAAEAVVESLKAELKAAEDVVKQIKQRLDQAHANVRTAMDEADAALPSCRMVTVRWSSGREVDLGRVAIVRKTPGGQLVVRQRDREYRFKLDRFRPVYRQAKGSAFYASDARELRDVPPEFLPPAGGDAK